jgi:hypothetical protein
MGAGLGLFLAWLICSALGEDRMSLAPSKGAPASTQVLLFAMLMLPAGLFFAMSVVTPIKIFTARYIIVSNIGLALLAGWGIGRLRPASARSIVTSSIVLCSIGAFGSVGHLWPLHNNQDWRGAMALVQHIAGSTRMPVVFQSPFIESATLLQDPTSNPPEFLLAPLAMYPVQARVIPVPLPLTQRSIAYMNASVIPEAEKADRFLLVTVHKGSDNPYINWLLGRLPNFRARNVGSFGADVDVTLYERFDLGAITDR